MKKINLPIVSRAEGAEVPNGVSVTDGRPLGRNFIRYRFPNASGYKILLLTVNQQGGLDNAELLISE